MDIFDHSNRIAIHEAGHAVMGWIMQLHSDKAFEGLMGIHYYFYEKERKIIAVCNFASSRVTNLSAFATKTRTQDQTITDLAINIAGSATYAAYIDESGDLAYKIGEIHKLFSSVESNQLVGPNHDFRYFSDIARFDFGIADGEVVSFAEHFNKQIVNIFLIPSVKESVELITHELLNLLSTDRTSLDSCDLERLEEIIFPKIEGKEIESEVQKLYSII